MTTIVSHIQVRFANILSHLHRTKCLEALPAFTAKNSRWCCLTERDSDENRARRVALSQRRETDQADKRPRSACLIFSPHKKQPKTKYSIHRFINRCVYAKNMLLYSKQTRPTALVFRGNPVGIEADGMDISDKNLRKLPIDRDMKKKDFEKAAVSAAMSFPK